MASRPGGAALARLRALLLPALPLLETLRLNEMETPPDPEMGPLERRVKDGELSAHELLVASHDTTPGWITSCGVMMPLFSRALSTQREPSPATWPKRIPIELPAAQPGMAMISRTTGEMSGVTRSSCVLTDGSGCQETPDEVAERDEISPLASVGAAAFGLASPSAHSFS